ncbi:SusD/RagB family nutrient-binding outer membrane lipoprotein [Chitinophaga tropicalis]|uniref:SusD/RagB family nutrient-binding outer membrane lipoprotein n=1 Tax=Chitinophaga tropicalis TaxID=2683588 RepID=A0A7K1TXV1_9BACT|nr:SusD/RagB family nutrient-binding outer membrane lipoprotein [Chitinophaga tropicalis]MVT06860.1 SusD/RagB family nutrient-binding outer membrane lipoprotein [Chitinophaga tropicalis]
MRRLSIYTGLLLLAVTFTGCKKFFDINDTPNSPTSVPPSLLLPTGLSGSAFSNANELNRFACTIIDYQAGAGGSPATYDIYNTNGADFGNQWRFEIYGGALIAYKKMIDAADATGAKAYTGIGKIMMAYTFAIATDVWGDVPYTEALQGDLDVIQPALTTQEAMYKGGTGVTSLFDMVRAGLRDLDTVTTSSPETDDIVYGGDIDAWKKAGNTLLLKLAIQISKKEPALAASVINEVLAKGEDAYITSNAETLGVNFGASTGSQSPVYYYTYVSSFANDLIVSTRYVNRLQALGDPRLDKFVTKPSGSFVTIDNGFRGTLPTPTANWSRWSSTLLGANGVGPVKLITNAMRAFILAEAAVSLPGINLGGNTAQGWYTEGIKASMQDAGLSSLEIDAYFTAHPEVVTLSGTVEQQVEQIITQKYIANTGNGLEAWNDWRRTGYPVMPEHDNAVGIDGTRPVRAQYIDQEVARNPAFKNGPLPNVKVWWDVN